MPNKLFTIYLLTLKYPIIPYALYYIISSDMMNKPEQHTYDDNGDYSDIDENGHVDGKEVGNMINGLKGMSSDQPQVLAVLVEQWRRLIDDYEGICS